MRIGSLFFLRLAFVFFNLLFAIRLLKLLENALQEEIDEEVRTEPKIAWRDIDVDVPPSVNDSLTELLRLNEFLARPQFTCSIIQSVGPDYESFNLCKDEEFLAKDKTEGLLITGSELGSGSFEAMLNISRWTVFLPEHNNVLDRLGGDVEVHYMTDLKWWKHWYTYDIEKELNGRSFGVAKLELYSSFFDSEDQTQVLEAILNRIHSKQLCLIIDLGRGAGAVRAASKWTQALNVLFFKRHFALISAHSSGICGRESQNCRYRVTLAHVLDAGRLESPVFGLGSPMEEQHRLLQYLSFPEHSTCHEESAAYIPAFCTDDMPTDALVLVFRYLEPGKTELPESLGDRRVIMISPHEAESFAGGENLRTAISVNQEKGERGGWIVKPLKTIVVDVEERHPQGTSKPLVLLFDLDGAEWDIFPQLLDLITVHDIRQVAFRMRIFDGEENENLRRFYWNLRRLEMSGFRKAFSIAESGRNCFSVSFLNRR